MGEVRKPRQQKAPASPAENRQRTKNPFRVFRVLRVIRDSDNTTGGRHQINGMNHGEYAKSTV
ncbi:MAG: hypothetical protein OXI43_00670 [Candidatus Poribacteria bacterium]|nr:hypothetical protein [Candidatus Poribacteria bacterium]